MKAVEVVGVGQGHEIGLFTDLHEIPVKGSSCGIDDLTQLKLNAIPVIKTRGIVSIGHNQIIFTLDFKMLPMAG